MKFCSHCRAEVMDAAAFCPNCGSPMAAPATAPLGPNVKYCSHCGTAVHQEALVCPKCGCAVATPAPIASKIAPGLQTAAKIFMVLSCVGEILAAVMMLIMGISVNYWDQVLVGEVSGSLVIPEFANVRVAFYVAAAVCAIFVLFVTIPMTRHYAKATKNHQPVSVGFKICTLIFINFIAGILMLCDTSNNQQG